MLSCQKAAELVHKRHNEGLTRTEKIKLRIHTNMCAVCKTFEKQTEQIEIVIKSRLNEHVPTDLSEFKSDTIAKIRH